jgi:hypothetical protein
MSMKYFKKHPAFTASVHALGGIGVGILITYPLVGNHPVRWALVFIGLALAGHVWALTHKA